MAHEYDIYSIKTLEIGHTDPMSRLRFIDAGNELVATVSAMLEKPVVVIIPFQKGFFEKNSEPTTESLYTNGKTQKK